MITNARSDCSRVALLIGVVLLLTTNPATAKPEDPAEVVVQYSIDVYDKDPARKKVEELRQTLADANSPFASASYSTLKIMAQKKFCKLQSSAKLNFTLVEGQSTSVQFNSGELEVHVIAELVQLSEDSCSLNLRSRAAGTVVAAEGTGTTSERSQPRSCPLDGTPVFIGGGGGSGYSSDGPGYSSSRSSTIRVWRRDHADAPNTHSTEPEAGREIVKRNMEILLKKMAPQAPQFLRLDPDYDRLVFVHPSDYLENLDVGNASDRLENRSRNALDEISSVVKIDDAQREKIRLTFRRRNSNWQDELERFYLQTLSDPMAAGSRDSQENLKRLNEMLVEEFTATDSFVWRVMKTQFTDAQESALSSHFVRKFVQRFAEALDVSDDAQVRLTAMLDDFCKTEGGFVLDEQEYLDCLLDLEDPVLKDLIDSDQKTEHFRRLANVSSNVEVFFWNAAL